MATSSIGLLVVCNIQGFSVYVGMDTTDLHAPRTGCRARCEAISGETGGTALTGGTKVDGTSAYPLPGWGGWGKSLLSAA
jgi:hypothetical protein